MGRAPCCDKANVKKGPWSPEEDAKLKDFINKYGTAGNWISLPLKAGLKRCGKSCRLRWLNYLRPNIKHGEFTQQEDSIICNLYATIGSRWSIIAGQLPGRTDNDIKNYWNTKLKKKLLASLQPKSLPHPYMNSSSLYYTSTNQPHEYPISTPQNFVNYYFNNINNPFNYQSDQDVQYYSSNMLMFGGGKEASCSSSDSQLSSYGTGNIQVKRQQIGSSSYHQGFMIDDHTSSTTSFLDHEKITSTGGVVADYNVQLQYDLEQVKDLITSSNVNMCNNNNNMNLLVDDDENKRDEKEVINHVMYYY